MQHFDRNQFSLLNSVGHLIAQLNQLKDRILELHVVDHGITAPQFKIILLISQGRGGTSGEFARLLNIDSGAMTRMLDRLEAKGLIVRERSQTDRRQIRIVLSAQGQVLAEQVPRIAADASNDLVATLSSDELAELQRLMKKLLVAAGAYQGED
ncbi:MarR family winged helix-turn-helix transcriptional regulator [Pseudomonas sp. LRF_L74]|uniref:MarR family winged helix-turn-helix transcriptional regulator n=1 Tax=Pseudomonas sp. LRF_L74 TaxID=3369422 RepID=UPI003F637614